jgi:hypothetical protein
MKQRISVLFFLLSGSTVGAWDEFGHMVIAEIALQCLSRKLQLHVKDLSAAIKDEFSPPESSFVQAAVWADTVRFNEKPGWQFYNHFKDTPFDPQYVLTTQQEKLVQREGEHANVIFATNQLMQAFTKEGTKDKLEQIIALRLITHYIGDLHQPLHAIDRYSKKNPQGDEGGNLYDVIFHGKKTNIHEVWDNCFGQFNLVNVPPSKHDLSYIKRTAENLLFEYHQIREKGPIDVAAWTNESYQYAKDQVYKAERSTELSQEYYEQNKRYAAQCLVTAGRRLAFVLKEILSQETQKPKDTNDIKGFFNQAITWWGSKGNLHNNSNDQHEH